MNGLPDEVYRHIRQYIFSPKHELDRWDKSTNRWKDLLTTKCHICNRQAYKSNIGLAHLCKVCDSNEISGVYHNLLICRECADTYEY